jgi:threonine dehydrogenase-like Zn-dependent dehydrogenase
MGKMLAARYLAPNRIEAVELDVPTLDEGQALVQVEACGICGSDLTIAAGLHPRARAPLTLGHELCGRVVEIRGTGNSGFKARIVWPSTRSSRVGVVLYVGMAILMPAANCAFTGSTSTEGWLNS